MKKLFLSSILVSILLISGCGGGSGSTSSGAGAGTGTGTGIGTGTEVETETYNSYAGDGIGSTRLLQSTSSEKTSNYSYDIRGNIKKIERIGPNGIHEEDTFAYNTAGYLKEATRVTTDHDGTVSIFTITNKYGGYNFIPLNKPVLHASDTNSTIEGCESAAGDIAYTYALNNSGQAAVALIHAQLTSKAIDPQTCSETAYTLDVTYSYDDKGRLKQELTKIVETDVVTSSISYTYDAENKLTRVKEVLFPENHTLEETLVTEYKIDGGGRVYADKTTETLTSTGKTTVTEYIYEDKTCSYDYQPNFFFPSGEKTVGMCLRP